MPFKIALILAIVFQVTSVLMALRLHWKYKAHSAWIMISAAATLVAIQQGAMLLVIWPITSNVPSLFPLWMACMSAILVSVLFLGGFMLTESLFVELDLAKKVLLREKGELESTVRATEDELRLARQIQQNLLPDQCPSIPNFEIAGASKPAEWTSGDYYDYIPKGDGLMVVVADVSGHGTGPALLMVETRAFLRVLSGRLGDIGEILTSANRAIAADIETNQFVTAFIAELIPATRELIYAAAGHDALIIDTQGNYRNISADRPPLGILGDTVIQASDPIQLVNGDILLLMTDGIPEANSGSGEQFGDERVVAVVHANRAKPAQEIVAALFEAVSDFAGEEPQSDDVTAVVVKTL